MVMLPMLVMTDQWRGLPAIAGILNQSPTIGLNETMSVHGGLHQKSGITDLHTTPHHLGHPT